MFAKSCEVRFPMGIPFRGPAFTLSLSLDWHGVALDDLFKKPDHIFVFNPPLKNIKEDFVVYAVKKFLNVAFQNKACPRAVLRDSAGRIFQNADSFMRSVSRAARKGGRNKGRLKERIDDRKNGVVQHPIPHSGLVDMPLLRIADVETGVGAVLVSFLFQLAVHLEDMLLDVPLESGHVPLVSFIALKGVPR